MSTVIFFTSLTIFVVLLNTNVSQQSKSESKSKASGGRDASSSSCKRSRENVSSQSEVPYPMKKVKILAYSKNTTPLDPKLTLERIESIRLLEEQISKADGAFEWNVLELPEEMRKSLCVRSFQQELIDGITMIESMYPDCDTTMTNGPSSINRGGGRTYYGLFLYYLPKKWEHISFYPDLLRCNCAYTYKNVDGESSTVRNSKRFFFLLKQCENLYIVLTLYGDLRTSRQVRIINVLDDNQP